VYVIIASCKRCGHRSISPASIVDDDDDDDDEKNTGSKSNDSNGISISSITCFQCLIQ